MPLTEVWSNIPAGSRLHVTIDPDSGFGVTGTHTVITANGPVLRGAIASSHFPLLIPVGGVDQHVVDFQLLSIGADVDIDVVARVEEPDGSTFQDPASATIQLGSATKVDTVTLFANG